MRQRRPPADRKGLDRARYFNRQVILPADLAQNQIYHLEKLRRHYRLLHGWGIRLGFAVELVPLNATPDDLRKAYGVDPSGVDPHAWTWVVVRPGFAVTPLGDEIYLPCPVFVDTAREWADYTLLTAPLDCRPDPAIQPLNRRDGWWSLVVEAWEEDAGAVRTATDRCGDSPEQFDFSRVVDTVAFRLIPMDDVIKDPFSGAAGATDLLTGNPKRVYICLGEVQLRGGQIQGSPGVMSRDPALAGPPPGPSVSAPVADTPNVPAAPNPQPAAGSPLPTYWPVALVLLLLLGVGLLAWLQRPQTAGGDAFAPQAIAPDFLTGRTDSKRNDQGIYQYGRFEAMHVPMPVQPVRIDGDITEWDQRAAVHSRLEGPGDAGPQDVDLMMMADKTFLYLGAHVRDPAPLRNKIVPGAANLDDVYKGGSVQVHLCTDPVSKSNYSIAYPLDHPSLVHIHLWYAGDSACLAVFQLGQDERGRYYAVHASKAAVPDSPCEAGAFRMDNDCRGYTLEYRIPWALIRELSGREPPGDGQEHGVCWDVHWSDESGSHFRAKLSEILNGERTAQANPAGDELSYRTPKIWGKAVFHRR